MEPEPPAHKPTPNLYFEQPYVRRSILIASWIVVLLGVPLWWQTTEIQRLPLPSITHVSDAVKVTVEQVDPTLIEIHPGPLAPWSAALAQTVEQHFAAENDIRVRATIAQGSASNASCEMTQTSFEVEVVAGLDHPILQSRRLLVPETDAAKRLPERLSPLLFPYASGYRRGGLKHLVSKFSPRYRLAFTLLNEDAALGRVLFSWDIRSSLQRHISPVIDRLSALHNFTVESQVRFHSPLAFEPLSLGSSHDPAHGLTQDDLKVFVNSAEWNLASQVSNDPVLHFVLFIPTASHSPLLILDSNGEPTSSSAFILPQWGGIMIANQPPDAPAQRFLTEEDLDRAFATFRKQLLVLLGVSQLPQDYEIANNTISEWQLDTLYRQRTRENTASSLETLESIVKLVAQIPNMPVGQDVKGAFQVALEALETAFATHVESRLVALQASARAVTHASKAFFSPGMLALLYFPPEHTYAVYTPLFFPMMGPLVATALREFSAWRKERTNSP